MENCKTDFLCTLISATFLLVSKFKMIGMLVKLREVKFKEANKTYAKEIEQAS